MKKSNKSNYRTKRFPHVLIEKKINSIQILFLVLIISLPRKVIMPLRCKGLLRVKENEKNLVSMRDNKRTGFKKIEKQETEKEFHRREKKLSE